MIKITDDSRISYKIDENVAAKRNFRGTPSFVAPFPNRRPSGRVSLTGSVGRNAIWFADIWKSGGRSCANCA